MSNILKDLSELLEEAGLKITFDPKRDITLCAKCGARNLRGWKTKAPETEDKDCRRLCDGCAKQEG